MVWRDGASVRLITRNGNDFTKRFPLGEAAHGLVGTGAAAGYVYVGYSPPL